MSFCFYNPNPRGLQVGDCTVRALSAITGRGWYDAYDRLCDRGRALADMPSSDPVWADELKHLGLQMRTLPNRCPACMTIKAFAEQHPRGIYILASDAHVTALVDGVYLDSWDSGPRVVKYFFEEA